MKLKALSLWEPWASLMRCGAKRIETRGWATNYRGPLLICGAKRWTEEQRQILLSFDIRGVLDPEDMLLGKAACIVDLCNCLPTEAIRPSPLELQFGDYRPGRFGWCTGNLRVIEPFPVKGRQGLFEVEVPDDFLEAPPQ